MGGLGRGFRENARRGRELEQADERQGQRRQADLGADHAPETECGAGLVRQGRTGEPPAVPGGESQKEPDDGQLGEQDPP